MNVCNPAVRLGLLPAGIALALAPAFASAQEAKGTTDLDRISVTGSRIRGANMETQQPILTMTRESLEKQGFSSVADVLNNLTSAGSPALSRSESLASGDNVGGYYVDLRNLGWLPGHLPFRIAGLRRERGRLLRRHPQPGRFAHPGADERQAAGRDHVGPAGPEPDPDVGCGAH